MAEVVLDASAIIAYLRAEPGGETVETLMDGALVSAINLAEVVGKLVDRGLPTADAIEIATLLPLNVAPVDMRLGLRIGAFREITAHRGLSLGDRACLALAEQAALPAVTSDRAWRDLDIGVAIQVIR